MLLSSVKYVWLTKPVLVRVFLSTSQGPSHLMSFNYQNTIPFEVASPAAEALVTKLPMNCKTSK